MHLLSFFILYIIFIYTLLLQYFALDLRFGPYHIDYTDNGRHLVIGGKKGHVATFDWQTKHLHNETNTMEAIRDVSYVDLFTFVYPQLCPFK